MKHNVRLIIPNERIDNSENNLLKLSTNEAHYLDNVIRKKTGDEVYVVNGKGSLWKGIKKDNSQIDLFDINHPLLFREKEKILIGLAISIPKKGFDDVLKMCTEIGVDLIQPIYSQFQLKKGSEKSSQTKRWDKILNESVEQSERLWKPKLFKTIDINEWLDSLNKKDNISISITRKDDCLTLKEWADRQTISTKNEITFWNVIGPEGGWSKKEIKNFQERNIQFVKLSKSILRTSTAAVNAISILNQWRNDDLQLLN